MLFISLSVLGRSQSEEAQIREVMDQQIDCWNAGDLECFMEGYWKSDQLLFIGKNGVTYGWQQTLDRYKKSYPDRQSMGTLTFDIKIVEPLESQHWFVVGRWTLDDVGEDKKQLTGHFSLVWRRLGHEWVIVSDHSS
ncbi:MAG: nuclear transport factor 2 family protein [Cyclobacteriaceae bacterium]|nr:nuclear transport factor 2 family protein [Cyclobacteriaceae bacterium HetDA_MAG_MS6]